jgi:hypothetical protein
MAISIDWGTKVIFVPQADLTFVSGTLYSLDVDQFRKDLNAKLLGLDAETAGAVWDMLASAGTATPDSMGELVEKVRKLAALIPGGL